MKQLQKDLYNRGENIVVCYDDNGEVAGLSGSDATAPRPFCSVCGALKTWHGHPHCAGDTA